jgi:hypothetical protein
VSEKELVVGHLWDSIESRSRLSVALSDPQSPLWSTRDVFLYQDNLATLLQMTFL